MTIDALVELAHEAARSKGWTNPDNPLVAYALIHSEISEAVEEARKDIEAPIYQKQTILWDSEPQETIVEPGPEWKDSIKPEGQLIELADAVIRIAHYCGAMGWNLGQAIQLKMTYNQTRSHRHGGKRF